LIQEIRNDLLASLNKRFSNLINQDICVVSTFLDPHFGPDSFPVDKLQSVKTKLVSLIKHQTTVKTIEASAIEKSNEKENIEHPNKKSKLETKKNENYVNYKKSIKFNF
jgi:hypothetical protein